MRPTPLPAPLLAPLVAPLLAPLVAAALLAGCTGDPEPTPTPSPSPVISPLPAADPDREALEGMVGQLHATVTALRTELEAAAAGDADALGAAAELLVADVPAVTTDVPDDSGGGGGGGGGFSDSTGTASTPDDDATPPAVDLEGPAPILPGPLASRQESIQYGDLLTRTLAAARGAGPHGEPVVRFLAEPLAGDLGSWQRSPADQLAAIAQAGAGADLAATEAAVLELGGEAPRALAWVVHGLSEPADATDAAIRALAHLAIIELSLEQLA